MRFHPEHPRTLPEIAQTLTPEELEEFQRYARARGFILMDDALPEDVERLFQQWQLRL